VRATALVYQDGVLCKTGALTRRYIGTFYTSATTTTEDSVAFRYLWNYNNRVQRRGFIGSTNSHGYNGGFRQWDANAANQLNFVCGYAEDAIAVKINGQMNATNSVQGHLGLNLDSTSAVPNNSLCFCVFGSTAFNEMLFAETMWAPQLGYHFFSANESSASTGTTTFSNYFLEFLLPM
jgi:hypothetical protein